MLILRRKEGERVLLADDEGNPIATITIHKVRGRTVELSIDAEDDIEIERAEVASAEA